jgi:undecaprenyl-diphosphatase
MTYQTLNHLDVFIIHGLNSLIGRSAPFDKSVAFLLGNPLSTAFLMSIFWACWFRPADTATTQRTREHLLATLWAGVASIVISRAFALGLPFRLRPRFDPTIDFLVTDVPNYSALMDWSAFPSDHAAMFFAFSIGLGWVSWRLSLMATIYVAFVICFPRVYFGYHYPTDILVGMIIGASCTYGFNLAAARRWLAAPVLKWGHSSPQLFHMGLFLLTFQFATMFNSLRDLASITYHLIEKFLKLH